MRVTPFTSRFAALTATLLAAGAVFAQPAPRPRPAPSGNESDAPSSWVRTEGSGMVDEANVRTAREVDSHSTGTPNWANPPGFEKDVFTFARSVFKAGPTTSPSPVFHRGRSIGWWVDFPDADLNLSYRLQKLTSIRADPDGRVLRLTEPELNDYPFLYMTHPGATDAGDLLTRLWPTLTHLLDHFDAQLTGGLLQSPPGRRLFLD